MTTKVTIDAHAGWDVEIHTVNTNETGDVVSDSVFIVPKNTVQDIYIHSNKHITKIVEIKGF